MTDRPDRQSRAWAMLTARAQQYERVPGSFDSLKPRDIAAMLAGLDHRPYVAGMLCEAGDWAYLPRCASYLYREADALCDEGEWNLPRGVGQLKNLVYLALVEATVPSVECVACNGVGTTADVKGERSPCELCRGRARLPVIQETRAEILEVDESNWKRTWRERYFQVDAVLQGWVTAAREHMQDALAGRQPEQLAASIRRQRDQEKRRA
ncbi:MAG: hypothetical protein AB7O95_20915 [Geminicoccaceae bacterium]